MILIAEENKAILDSSFSNINKTLFELKEMLKEGFIEDTDVDQLQLTVMNIENTLKALNRQIEIAYRLLKFQMGIDVEENISLSENLVDIVEKINVESILNDSFDYNKNINYQLLSTQEHLTLQNLRMEKTSILPTYKMVDTCAAEFEAKTPYYYSTYETETEVRKSDKKKVLIIGGGPIRIGQGIEFDYCTVHAVFELKDVTLIKNDVKVLDGMNLDLRKGEIHGIVGVEGNGQSEIIDILFGLKKKKHLNF